MHEETEVNKNTPASEIDLDKPIRISYIFIYTGDNSGIEEKIGTHEFISNWGDEYQCVLFYFGG